MWVVPMLLMSVAVYFVAEQFPAAASAFLVFMLVSFACMLISPAAGATLVLIAIGMVMLYAFILMLPYILGVVFGVFFLLVFLVSLGKLIGG